MTLHVYEDELPALALGVLGHGETRAICEHLDMCPRCRAMLGAYRAVVRLLPYEAQPREPPDGLKQRILARIARAGGLEDATIMHDTASIEGR
jgi:anti-sigma factor ChrR (cupin superfamily)